MPETIPHPSGFLKDESGVAIFVDAWDLTRRLSPRPVLRTMKRDAYGRLDENSFPHVTAVGPLVPSTPWAMYLADDAGLFRFIAFDFDGKVDGVVDPDLMESAVDQADALSSVLESLAIAHVVCQSSSTGGRHIWVALRTGVDVDAMKRLASAARANYSTLDFGMLHNSSRGAVRPPLSPHRDGSSSTVLRGDLAALLQPSCSPDDLQVLAEALDASKPAPRPTDTTPSGPVDALFRGHRELSAWGLSHMATIDGGSNPSWTGFMCLLAAASAGWGFRDVEQAARTAPGMEHYRTRNSGRGTRRPRAAAEARARLERQWDRAQQYAALYRPLPASREPRDLTELNAIVTDVSDLLGRLKAAPGRWGQTESATSQRTILIALAFLTLQTGKRHVAASIRDLALMAGLGRTTAAEALQALNSAGFIEKVTNHDGGNAAEWRLTPHFSTAPRTVRPQPLNNPRPPTELFSERAILVGELERQLTAQRHDLFSRAGLGHSAGRLYAFLVHSPGLSLDAAARALGLTSRYAATILSRLRSHKLIVSFGDGWGTSKRDLRNHAARVIGVAGALAARAERYRGERELWAWWQAEVDRMHSAPRRRPRHRHVTSRPLFESSRSGERDWPAYPRMATRGNHRLAWQLVMNGVLRTGPRFYELGDAA
jgi:DNA-binding MarR family transcriptional regulator